MTYNSVTNLAILHYPALLENILREDFFKCTDRNVVEFKESGIHWFNLIKIEVGVKQYTQMLQSLPFRSLTDALLRLHNLGTHISTPSDYLPSEYSIDTLCLDKLYRLHK